MAQQKRRRSASDPSGMLHVRPAKASDAKRIAELSGQLGYPAKTREISGRLRNIKRAPQHAVLVAESPENGVIGWVHVSVEPQVGVELRAEVNGLVVADEERSRGAGAVLLRSAEKWARAHGCRNMSVRSNVLRERAHQFYVRNGFEHYKTQKAFRKTL
jgi:GNAT superfamily N-acetyltransferase